MDDIDLAAINAAMPNFGLQPSAAPIRAIPEMTLRDYLAGQALIGVMAHLSADFYAGAVDSDDWSFFAGDAYRIADEMLKTRERTNL